MARSSEQRVEPDERDSRDCHCGTENGEPRGREAHTAHPQQQRPVPREQHEQTAAVRAEAVAADGYECDGGDGDSRPAKQRRAEQRGEEEPGGEQVREAVEAPGLRRAER